VKNDNGEVIWACSECGNVTSFTNHVDWETGYIDDVHCNECKSYSTGEIVDILRDVINQCKDQQELICELNEQVSELKGQACSHM
jgi:hypothetical protein